MGFNPYGMLRNVRESIYDRISQTNDEEFRKPRNTSKRASNTKRILIESYDPVPEDQDLANVVCNRCS